MMKTVATIQQWLGFQTHCLLVIYFVLFHFNSVLFCCMFLIFILVPFAILSKLPVPYGCTNMSVPEIRKLWHTVVPKINKPHGGRQAMAKAHNLLNKGSLQRPLQIYKMVTTRSPEEEEVHPHNQAMTQKQRKTRKKYMKKCHAMVTLTLA